MTAAPAGPCRSMRLVEVEMPDIASLLSLVRWDVVAGLSAIPVLLLLVSAIIHPIVFNLVTLLLLGFLVAVGYSDTKIATAALSPEQSLQIQAQFAEMALVALGVIAAHIIIRWIFKNMARATRLA